MSERERLDGFSALLRTALLVGIFSIGSTALAVDITQPPSAFEITTDGIFTTPDEWSDVTPAVRLGGESLVYTSADPGLGALYLMYDLPSSTAPLPPGSTAGPVHFHNSGADFDVFFTCSPASILVLKDGIPFDVSDPTGGEDSIEGACGFGPSPSSATPHNMFELEVLFDGSDPTLAGHSHGQYSPDPSHWGAALPTDPGQTQDPTCTLPNDPDCDAANDPQGGGAPTQVPCPPGGPGQDPDIRFSFGDEVSNACVNVVRGSGGVALVTAIPFPGQAAEHFKCYKEKVKAGKLPAGTTVLLADQFEQGEFALRQLGLCNPVEKRIGGVITPIFDPDTHLTAYQIKPVGFKLVPHLNNLVINQFGNLVVDTSVRGTRLLVPAGKSLAGPASPPNPANDVDHFLCYEVAITPGTPKFQARTVSLGDQFTQADFNVKAPKLLCNPAEKVRADGTLEPIKNFDRHLMCYSIKRVKGSAKFAKVSGVFTNDQFVESQVLVTGEELLCLPSLKTPLP